MTLCDNWDFYTGGRQQFLKWRGITDHSKFWTDPGCKADYKAYVATLVNRTNSLTGVAYKDDPTILCWESANEFASPPEWEREMAVYIKSLDPNHLFMVGNSDVADSRHADVQKRWIAIPEFDILQRHYYRVHGLPWAAAKDAEGVAAAGKVFIIGEYGWDGQNATIEELKGWLKEVETNTTVSGDLLWALRGRKDKDNFMAVPGAGGDWWALYYPGRTTGSLNKEEDMKVRVRMLSDHAAAMNKETP
jgi:mannan endo-1,4-beta-mannosidase